MEATSHDNGLDGNEVKSDVCMDDQQQQQEQPQDQKQQQQPQVEELSSQIDQEQPEANDQQSIHTTEHTELDEHKHVNQASNENISPIEQAMPTQNTQIEFETFNDDKVHQIEQETTTNELPSLTHVQNEQNDRDNQFDTQVDNSCLIPNSTEASATDQPIETEYTHAEKEHNNNEPTLDKQEDTFTKLDESNELTSKNENVPDTEQQSEQIEFDSLKNDEPMIDETATIENEKEQINPNEAIVEDTKTNNEGESLVDDKLEVTGSSDMINDCVESIQNKEEKESHQAPSAELEPKVDFEKEEKTNTEEPASSLIAADYDKPEHLIESEIAHVQPDPESTPGLEVAENASAPESAIATTTEIEEPARTEQANEQELVPNDLHMPQPEEKQDETNQLVSRDEEKVTQIENEVSVNEISNEKAQDSNVISEISTSEANAAEMKVEPVSSEQVNHEVSSNEINMINQSTNDLNSANDLIVSVDNEIKESSSALNNSSVNAIEVDPIVAAAVDEAEQMIEDPLNAVMNEVIETAAAAQLLQEKAKEQQQHTVKQESNEAESSEKQAIASNLKQDEESRHNADEEEAVDDDDDHDVDNEEEATENSKQDAEQESDEQDESAAVADVVAAVEKAMAAAAASGVTTTPRTATKKKQSKSSPTKSAAAVSSMNTSDDLTSPQSSLKRRKKDPYAPKAPLNGYLVYFNEERAEMRKINPSMSFGELTKIIAAKWKDLPSELKQKYINEADVDKERYVKEMADYKRSDSFKQYHKENASKMFKMDDNSQSSSSSIMLFNETNGNGTRALSSHHGHHTNGVLSGTESSDVPNIAWLQQEARVAGFDIPIFTEEFVEHCKSREQEMRALRKDIIELEQQNSVLHKHIDNLKQSSMKIEQDIDRYKTANGQLLKHLDVFRQTILHSFVNVPLPNTQEYPTLATIDDYIVKLFNIVAMVNASNGNDQDPSRSFVLHVKSVLSRTNFKSLFEII